MTELIDLLDFHMLVREHKLLLAGPVNVHLLLHH